MFRRPDKPASGKKPLSQYGLLDIPDINDDNDDDLGSDLDGDLDLEAELAAISGGATKKPRPKPKPAAAPTADLNAMIAASLKDIPSDEEVSDDDDPDLLNELQALSLEDQELLEAPAPPPRSSRSAPAPPGGGNSMVDLLQERISNYVLAEKNAKANGESARARRFSRGLKTLQDLLKQARAGKTIKDDDIPPPVSTGQPSAPKSESNPPVDVQNSPETEPQSPVELPPSPVISPSQPSPQEPSTQEPGPPEPSPTKSVEELSPERQKGLRIILQKKEEFKAAALSAKHSGDKARALELLKMVKQFDLVVEAYKSGQEMDLSELPSPSDITAPAGKEEESVQQNAMDTTPSEPVVQEEGGLVTASSVEEALQQRLLLYKDQEAKAKEQNNSSKMRRMGRIVKQYQDAIKLHAAGRPIPLDELPNPPGYAPIPTGAPAPRPAPPPQPSPSAAPAAPKPAVRKPAPQVPAATTRAGKQLDFLLQRQKEFKEAAILAKKNGDIGQAKEYLRNAKGFDSLIEAAEGGIAIDLNSLPLPPQAKKQLEDTFDVITASDCDPNEEDILSRLQEQLNTQLKLCLATRDHNKAIGNVAETNRFEHLAMNVKQDLDVVVVAKRMGSNPPKFHYETRQFSVIQCNTDLNDNDLELTIVRGITYNVPNPKEIDTYVKFEFPYPQEEPVTNRTSTVKDTNSPEYNAVFPLAIQRTARPCLRVFKRHAVKIEVYSKGGFFSRDQLLGTVNVKLQPLENQCTLHEAFPLMDGRRAAGGSLEVKLRVRTPLLVKQVENQKHRWLVIDN